MSHILLMPFYGVTVPDTGSLTQQGFSNGYRVIQQGTDAVIQFADDPQGERNIVVSLLWNSLAAVQIFALQNITTADVVVSPEQ